MTEPLTPAQLAAAQTEFPYVLTHLCNAHGHAITLCWEESEFDTLVKFFTECVAGTAVDRSFVDEKTGRIEGTLIVVPPECAQNFLDGIEEMK